MGTSPEAERDGDIVEAYYRRLNDANLTVRQQAAEAWCLWESATPAWPPLTGLAPRFTNPPFALEFARIVTHYMHLNLWLEVGSLLRNVGVLAAMPAIMVDDRLVVQAPSA